jgi:RNA polymerase sigma factor (sigma-70 family)
MSYYTLYPSTAPGGESPLGQYRAEEALSMEQAMARHERLIHAFIYRQGGGAIPYEEALQAGRIGLWRAILGYDPSRGTAFSTYAWVAIRRTIHQAVEESERGRACWSKALPLAWYLPDLEERVDQLLVYKALYACVDRLPDRLKTIIVFRYGLDGHPLRTLGQLGAELGISYERVRQLQQDALARLRHPARSNRLRQLVGKNKAVDYRHALAQNAALRRSRRRKR